MSLETWLQTLELDQYSELFKEQAIDMELLRSLEDHDLEKMGIASLGHRKKIMQAIQQLEAAPAMEVPGYAAAMEEVELRDYLVVLWGFRRYFMGAVVVFTLFFWIYKGAVFFGTTSPFANYTSLLTLSFPGYEKEAYPNGSRFKLEDLIAANVLKTVYENQQIDDNRVPLNAFLKSFKISYQSAAQEFIQESYRKKISLIDEKLKMVEVDKLQADLKEELAQDARSQVVLTFTKNDRWPLRDQEIESILEAVPEVWKEQAINEKGVFQSDLPHYNVASLFGYKHVFGGVDGAEEKEPLIALNVLLENVGHFQQYLEDLMKVPNIQNYTTSKRVLSIYDIEREIKEIAAVSVPNLIFSFSQLGVYQDSIEVFLFYDSQIFQLEQEMELLVRKSQVVLDIIETYADMTEDGSSDRITQQNNARGATIPQFDESFLSAIIDLASKSDDVIFKKELMAELKGYRLKYTEIRSAVDQLIALKAKLFNTKNNSDMQRYREKVEMRNVLVVDRLTSLLTDAQELENMTGYSNFQDQSMYVNLGYHKKEELLPEMISSVNIKGFTIGVVLVCMVVTLIAFLSSYIKQKTIT